MPPNIRDQVRNAHLHRAILEVAEWAYDAEHDFLEGKIRLDPALWRQVTALLITRALQLQRAILDGVTIGYDEELHPVARAMASTVVTVAAITSGRRHHERDRKALRYLVFAAAAGGGISVTSHSRGSSPQRSVRRWRPTTSP